MAKKTKKPIKRKTKKRKSTTRKPKNKISIGLSEAINQEKITEIADTLVTAIREHEPIKKEILSEEEQNSLIKKEEPKMETKDKHFIWIGLAIISIIGIIISVANIISKQNNVKVDTVVSTNTAPTELTVNKTIIHTIKKNDNLWSLASNYYNNTEPWVMIYFYNTNSITFPDLIITGHEVKIPFWVYDTTCTNMLDKEISKNYFSLYIMYRKIGWMKHAEDMLFMCRKLDKAHFEELLTSNELVKNDWDNISKGKNIK